MNKLRNPYGTVIAKDNCATHRTFSCLFDDTAVTATLNINIYVTLQVLY